MGTSDDATLAALLTAIERRLAEVAQRAYTEVREQVPLYRSGDVVPTADLRRSIEHNLRFLLRSLQRGEATDDDLRAPIETGQRRAQQSAPLPEALQAYRITFRTFWDALLEEAQRVGGPAAPEHLLRSVSRILNLTDQHAIALTEAYRAEQAELLADLHQRRGALVESLLLGRAGAEGGPWEAAALLGMPPDSELVVVAAHARGLAEEALPRAERHLAAHGLASGWRLSPAMQVGVVALGDTPLSDLVRLLQRLASSPVGVSPRYRSLSDTPRALMLARAALAARAGSGGEVRVFDQSPVAALVATDPTESARLEQEVLGSVLALPDGDSTMLLETLHTYLEQGGSADRAAEELYCHPNTVRYRLRRVQELTGRSLSDPFQLAELATASCAARLGMQDRTTAPRPDPAG